jgi:2-oxoglutarate ferredoxin oxidoreductase subunit gamma
VERTEIRFGGSGGQGVVLAARILGMAALLDGKNVLQTQAYGAEARGSMTKSELIISTSKIDFPAVRKSDILVAMSQEAANGLLKDLKDEGTIIVDSVSVTNLPPTKASVHRFPMTDAAKRIFGDGLYTNMVMLGVLSQVAPLAGAESIEEAIREATPARNAETNVKAFKEGLRLEPVH